MKIVNLSKETLWQFLDDTGDMFRGWIVPARRLAPSPPLQSGLQWVEQQLLPKTEQAFDRACPTCGQTYHGPRLVGEPCNNYAPDTLNPVVEDQDICTTCFLRGVDHVPSGLTLHSPREGVSAVGLAAVESFNEFLDEFMACPECGSMEVSTERYDFGTDRETGYHDSGVRATCGKCGHQADMDDFLPQRRGQ